MPNSLDTVIYVVQEYPAVTQTFVADEIAQVQTMVDTVVVFSLNNGRYRRVVLGTPLRKRHSSAVHHKVHLVSLVRAATLRPRDGRSLSRQAYALVVAVMMWLTVKRFDLGHFAIHAHFAGRAFQASHYLASLLDCTCTSVTLHAADASTPASDERTRTMLGKTRVVVTASDFVRAVLKESTGRSADAIIHCGLALDDWHFAFRSSSSNEAVQILSVGRLVEKKNFEVSIQASRLLDDLNIAHVWRVVGEGPLQAHLSTLAANTSVQLVGALPRDEIRRMLESWAHVFVLTPRPTAQDFDGIPVALMESMASGVPTVTSPIGGIPELVINGINGLLVDQEDAHSLAEALRRLAINKALAERLALNARQTVERDFNAHMEARKLITLLQG